MGRNTQAEVEVGVGASNTAAEPSRKMYYRCSLLPKQVTEVKALIGFFDLDPNRVYDVVLDAFECAPRNAALLALAEMFAPEARTQILGFKFQRLASGGVPAPDALFNIAAQLIKARTLRSTSRNAYPQCLNVDTP